MFDFELDEIDLEEMEEQIEELAYIFNMTEEEVIDMLLNMGLV